MKKKTAKNKILCNKERFRCAEVLMHPWIANRDKNNKQISTHVLTSLRLSFMAYVPYECMSMCMCEYAACCVWGVWGFKN